jgi:hypothetical protein
MWMKVDDRMHSHRKTRAVTKSHPEKMRDIAPMGLWVAAGSWSAQNGTDGWVPDDELDRWDDDWQMLAKRLVSGGYWWPEERDGEPGHGFNDWQDYNLLTSASSASGEFGNHVRWHVKRGVVEPSCEHCPSEPDEGESEPDEYPESGGDIGGRSGGDIAANRGGESLSESHNPARSRTRSDTNPKNSCASAGAERERDDVAAEFEQWYERYPRKRGRGQALKAYKAARRKADPETLVRAIEQQGPALTARGPEYVPYPATWLNGERWADQPDAAMATQVRRLPYAHELELPPDGLSPAEYAAWEREQRERRKRA